MKSVSLQTAQRDLLLLAEEMGVSNSGYVLTKNKKKVAVLLPVGDMDILEELEDLIWAARAEKILSGNPKLNDYSATRNEIVPPETIQDRNHRSHKTTIKKTTNQRHSSAR